MWRKRTRRSLTDHFGNLWNIGHIWPYILSDAHVWSAAGKPWDVRKESAVRHAHEHPGDISEVKFLTVAEVAAVMRVSKMTVYRLVHSGELPAVRVGRSFRVSEKDVNEYLKSSFFSRLTPVRHRRTATAHGRETPAPDSSTARRRIGCALRGTPASCPASAHHG